jgi:hypothetical protein
MSKNIQKGIADTEKKIAVYQYDNEKNNVQVVVDYKLRRISHSTFKEYKKNPHTSPCLLIKKDKKYNLQETYADFIKMADELKEATDGLINMYKTGDKIKTAKHFFYSLNKHVQTQPVTYDEYLWLENATVGAITYAKEYSGPAYSYDFVSMYPSIQSDHKMLFPIKKGEFIIYDSKTFNSAEFVSYGIYKCIIYESTKKEDIYLNKLFKFSKKNTYTHIDINFAKQHKLKIELIDNGEPNALIYSKDKLIQGNTLFGPYMKYLFDLKVKDVYGAKVLTQCLWGALSQKSEIKLVINNDNENCTEIYEGKEIIELRPLNEFKTMIKVIDKKNTYETEYARIKPFLLSKGRKKLIDMVLPFMDKVKFIHTDSAITTKKLNIMTGTKADIGKLYYEGECTDYNIKNIGFKDSKDKFKII